MVALPPITEEPIDGLEMSHSLKMFFYQNRLKALNELLRRPMSEWFSLTGFSQHLLQDLMGFLRQHSLQSFVMDE